MTLQAIGICLQGRYILLTDDTTVPIVALLDALGEETEEIDRCIGVIFQTPNKMFSTCFVSQFDPDMRIDAIQ